MLLSSVQPPLCASISEFLQNASSRSLSWALLEVCWWSRRSFLQWNPKCLRARNGFYASAVCPSDFNTKPGGGGTKEPDTENCVLWKEWVQLLTCPGSPGSPEMLLTLGTWTVALLCSKLPLVFIGTGYIRGCGCGLHGCGMEETELWAEERLQRSDAGELREPALIGWGCVLSFIHSVETYWPPTTCQKVC